MSKWLLWHRARYEMRPHPDYIYDDQGIFHCIHDDCPSKEEHEQRMERDRGYVGGAVHAGSAGAD